MSRGGLWTIHTLVPSASIPLGYFYEQNIQFIQDKIVEVLKREYNQKIQIDRGSIIRVMERVLTERIETIPKMNQRVIMEICNEYRTHQDEVNKHLKWESHYVLSQRLYDPSTEMWRFDQQKIKHPNHLGKPKVGGTLRFYST